MMALKRPMMPMSSRMAMRPHSPVARKMKRSILLRRLKVPASNEW